MFNLKRRRKRQRPDAGGPPVMGDIGMAADSVSEDAYGGYDADDTGQGPDTGPVLSEDSSAPEADDGIPESIPAEERELMRESRRARAEADEKNRRDDQTRQMVFSCACVVAGFCGIAGVIFGTAAVCRNLGGPPGIAASEPVQAPYVEGIDPSDMNVYYDQAGRMHVNVYLSKQPEFDINIRIDGEGNVTADTVPRDDGAGAQAPDEAQDPEGQPSDPGPGQDAREGGTEAGPGSDGASVPSQPAVSDNDAQGENPGTGAGTETGPEQGSEPDVKKDEAALLAEQEQRRKDGGSGYLESDGQYTVKPGDTLTKISNKTGFSVDFLAAYNGLANKNLIITGEILRYPVF